jgi:hypothetical protein
MRVCDIFSILTNRIDTLYATQNELNKLRVSQVDKAIEIQESNMDKMRITVS